MQIPIPAYQSLERILRGVLGNYTSAQFQQILQANNLDWPYLVDGDELTSAPATGTASLTWTGTVPTTLPVGTIITAPTNQTLSRSYTTDASITFTSVGQVKSVSIACTVDGEWGNTPPNTLGSVTGYSACTASNPGPITGGYHYHVVRPGDFLWIPDQFLANPNVPAGTVASYQHTIGPVDLATTPNGGMAWGVGDFATVQGGTTILQDAAHRIQTPVGSLWWSPPTGSLVLSSLGHSGATLPTRIAALSLSAVKQDGRLKDVAVEVTTLPNDPTIWRISVASQLASAPATTYIAS